MLAFFILTHFFTMAFSEAFSLFLSNEQESNRLGQALALALQSHAAGIKDLGFNIRLDGNLGAGKTTTTRAMLRALGVSGRVKSPTFTLVESYDTAIGPVHHFDFYRFETPQEFDDAGFRDLFGAGRVTVCEWPEKATPCLPGADLSIRLAIEGDGRKATFSPTTKAGKTIVMEIMKAWN